MLITNHLSLISCCLEILNILKKSYHKSHHIVMDTVPLHPYIYSERQSDASKQLFTQPASEFHQQRILKSRVNTFVSKRNHDMFYSCL